MFPAFTYNQYLLKRQVLALTGTFRIYNPAGELVLFARQKMFRLKEDLRVFSDESSAQEVLRIQARQVIDFAAAYDVYDSAFQQKVGVLRRRGWASLTRDTWQMLDAQERPLALLQEDNLTRALLRRFLLNSLLPQNYDLMVDARRVADYRQRFNLLRYELDIDFSEDNARQIDRRLGLALALLLGTIEGRQD